MSVEWIGRCPQCLDSNIGDVRGCPVPSCYLRRMEACIVPVPAKPEAIPQECPLQCGADANGRTCEELAAELERMGLKPEPAPVIYTDSLGRPMPTDACGLLITGQAAAQQERAALRILRAALGPFFVSVKSFPDLIKDEQKALGFIEETPEGMREAKGDDLLSVTRDIARGQ